MNNRTVGIIVTVLTALVCLCAAIVSCSIGLIGATNTPIDTTVNGQQSYETIPSGAGYAMLCLSVVFLATPIVVGFFTLRKKPAAPIIDEPIPPAT
jgi:Na+-transporting methylmalonyl-CoA/oxaloacetate decarboxylase beta subunit